MLNKGSLNLSSGQAVTRNVDNVVNTATDPVVTIVIATSAISGELDGRKSVGGLAIDREIGALRSSPYTHSGKYPYNACGHPKRCGPCWARAA